MTMLNIDESLSLRVHPIQLVTNGGYWATIDKALTELYG